MFFKTCEILVIFSLFAAAFGQISNSLDLDNLEKNLEDNPDLNDLQKKIEESGVNLNKTKIDPEKIANVLKEKCEKHNAIDAVDTLKNQQDIVKECVSKHLNGSQIQEELEEAKTTGSMDEVFAKYCKKWPDVYSCFHDATITVKRCLSEKEKKAFNKTLDIVQEFQQFMCFKDGDRLAMFVAEGGVECIQEQQEGVKECFNATISDRLPESDDLSIASLPTFLFTDDDCDDFDKVRTCVNGVLEKCKDTTPANIVDASFKFVKKQMVCGETGDQVALKAETTSIQTNSAYSLTNSILILLGLLWLLKLY